MDQLAGSSASVRPTNQRTIAPSNVASSKLGAWWPSLACALLGIVVTAGVGFAPGAAHDAAHDVRHTMSFPCH